MLPRTGNVMRVGNRRSSRKRADERPRKVGTARKRPLHRSSRPLAQRRNPRHPSRLRRQGRHRSRVRPSRHARRRNRSPQKRRLRPRVGRSPAAASAERRSSVARSPERPSSEARSPEGRSPEAPSPKATSPPPEMPRRKRPPGNHQTMLALRRRRPEDPLATRLRRRHPPGPRGPLRKHGRPRVHARAGAARCPGAAPGRSPNQRLAARAKKTTRTRRISPPARWNVRWSNAARSCCQSGGSRSRPHSLTATRARIPSRPSRVRRDRRRPRWG